MVLDEIKSLRQKAATQYSVLKACCYPSGTGNDITRLPDTIAGSRTIAETDGVRLTDLNLQNYKKVDIETRFIWMLHEVTHHEVTGNPQGKSSHNPEFWEAYQDNFNTLLADEQDTCIVKTLFGSGLDEFDWKRAKYRAVQNAMQVDKRSETVDERKEKMATALNYKGYNDFENGDWGLWMCGRNKDIPCYDDSCVRLNIGTRRFIAKYSVTENNMLQLIEENNDICPMPLITVTDEVNNESQSESLNVESNDNWEIAPVFTRQSQIALAVQERLGHNYVGLNVNAVDDETDPSVFSRASPVDTDELVTAVGNNPVLAANN